MKKFLRQNVSAGASVSAYQGYVDALNALGLDKISFSLVVSSDSKYCAINISKNGQFVRSFAIYVGSPYPIGTSVYFFGDEDGAWCIGEVLSSNQFCGGVTFGCFARPSGILDYLYLGQGSRIHQMVDTEVEGDFTYSSAVNGEYVMTGGYSDKVYWLDADPQSNGTSKFSQYYGSQGGNGYEATLIDEVVLYPLMLRTGHLMPGVYGSNRPIPYVSSSSTTGGIAAFYRHMDVAGDDFIQIGWNTWCKPDAQ